ncbi:MAG: hypothetical protein ACRDPT_14590 [Streptomycetales bacterium]
MRHSERRLRGWVACALVAGVLLAACGQSAESKETTTDLSAAEIHPVPGSDLARVTMTERAVERLGVQTTAVELSRVPVDPTGGDAKAERKVIPYSAVLYDPDGHTWAFTNPDGRNYIRAAIDVDYVDGDVAVLSDGPAVGTEVVTLGAAELYGAELGVDVE